MVAVPHSAEVLSPRRKRETRRLCALHRVERPIAELIRFVAAPDGAVVADLKQNLPGRGVWITADRVSIAKAVAARTFDRSLKTKTLCGAELATGVEALLRQRTLDALSLANKAGVVVTGFTKVDLAIQKQSLRALVSACDSAADGRDKLTRKFQAIPQKCASGKGIVAILTVSQISLAIGRPNVVHAGLTESGATEKFLFEARRLENFGLGLSAVTADQDAQSETR